MAASTARRQRSEGRADADARPAALSVGHRITRVPLAGGAGLTLNERGAIPAR